MRRIDDLISDVGYILDCLKALRSICETEHDCNTCAKTCEYRQWGVQVTYNCPLWESEE